MTYFPSNSYVYALLDPNTGVCRYVGQTANLPKDRYASHIYESLNKKQKGYRTHKSKWIRALDKKGAVPELKVLTELVDQPQEVLDECEIYWIKYFNDIGCKLTNHKEGGSHGKPSDETKLKMSIALKKRYCKNGHDKHDPEIGITYTVSSPGRLKCKICLGLDGSRSVKKTSCLKGHEFTEENTYIYKKKGGGVTRNCKTCRREQQRSFAERRKSLV
jgi:hypothetical protein